MSFTRPGGSADRSFHLVRQSLLQDDSLPFSDALTDEHVEQAFEVEGISFGQSDAGRTTSDDDGIVYTMGVTLWAMLSQSLFTGVQRSCRAAVQRVAAYYAMLGREVSSTNTGGYCRARTQVTEGVVQRLAVGVAERCDAAVPEERRWNGFRMRLIDGTTFSMPDTEENQAEYPQSSSQEPGLGFPIMRAVALTSLFTGMVIDLAEGPYSGKETGETALFRTLFKDLRSGDLVLADRYFGGWFMLALLQDLGVEFVTRLHQHRDADFDRGQRLGKKDHITSWKKPERPTWLDQETYDRLPDHLEVREIEVQVDVPGFRTKSLVVVTSLRNHKTFPKSEIATLYRQRWLAELELRDIKSTMELDILRCRTPEAVRRELWTGILAYNLVRQSMLQSAEASGYLPYQLSFAASYQMLGNTWLLAAMPQAVAVNGREYLIALRLLNGSSHRVGNRPNRIEPRAVKRRPSPIALLKELRETARGRLIESQRQLEDRAQTT